MEMVMRLMLIFRGAQCLAVCFLPFFALLILARVAVERFVPIFASLILARDAAECFLPILPKFPLPPL